MLEYIEPTLARKPVENLEFKYPPHSLWPSRYAKPDLEKWRKEAKSSLTRNLVVLLLYYFNVSTNEVAELMQLSESRVRSIIKATKTRLFGRHYRPSIDEIQTFLPFLKDNRKEMRDYASQQIEELEGNAPEIHAIFNALSRNNCELRDIQLCHHALSYLEGRLGDVDYQKYEYS